MLFQTAPVNIEHLTISLAENDAIKLQWTVYCISGVLLYLPTSCALFCHRDESAGTTHHAVISAAEPAISNLSEDMHAQMPLLLESM
jgi:uncharacterized protein YcgI (DUF1989 family)